ncbi:core histone h2A/H2B/H3/H4 domain-containing protein [Ditylenchus destructor]|nr:core histone h2A/H2B/H3/H4 domain-containing protein [Ditylenchus destructor]
MGRQKHVRVLAVTKQRSKRKASMEIAKYQKSTKLLIPFQPFSRLVKEILQECNKRLYIEKRAILALQDEAESRLVKLFQTANRSAAHAKRFTITPTDFVLVRWIIEQFTGLVI